MKKSFLYAITIAAALTACSSENDMATNDTTDGLQPITIGVAAPSISAGTRGTGTVGSSDNTNCWMGQTVNV